MPEGDRPPLTHAALFTELLRLARQQTAVLSAGDPVSFIDLMNERESLMQCLPGLAASEAGENANYQTANLAAQIEQILAVDRENQRLLARALKETKAELERVHHGRTALSRYGHLSLPPEARFCDRML